MSQRTTERTILNTLKMVVYNSSKCNSVSWPYLIKSALSRAMVDEFNPEVLAEIFKRNVIKKRMINGFNLLDKRLNCVEIST